MTSWHLLLLLLLLSTPSFTLATQKNHTTDTPTCSPPCQYGSCTFNQSSNSSSSSSSSSSPTSSSYCLCPFPEELFDRATGCTPRCSPACHSTATCEFDPDLLETQCRCPFPAVNASTGQRYLDARTCAPRCGDDDDDGQGCGFGRCVVDLARNKSRCRCPELASKQQVTGLPALSASSSSSWWWTSSSASSRSSSSRAAVGEDGEVINTGAGFRSEDCAPLCAPNCTQPFGTCVFDNATRKSYCECDMLHTGVDCSMPRCEPECAEGGTCELQVSPVGGGYITECNCTSEWHGTRCSVPLCPLQCENGGFCDHYDGKSQCRCTSDWSGPSCTTPVCAFPCHHGGNCSAPHTCTCSNDFKGADCSIAICRPSCKNEGACTGPDTCLCPSGWKGVSCSERSVISLPPVLLSIAFAIVVVASWSIGKVVPRLKMPLITGYIMVGIVAGPHVLNLVPEDEIRSLDFIDKVALAFIAFAAGSKLYLVELRGRLKSVFIVAAGLVVVEYALGCTVVVLMSSDIHFMEQMSRGETVAVSMLIGTLLVARSPASAIAIVDEMKASGPFTLLCIGVTVVLDVAVIFIFSVNMLVADSYFSGSTDSGGGASDGKSETSPAMVFGRSVLRLVISIGGGAMLGYVIPYLIWGWERVLCHPIRSRFKAQAIEVAQVLLFLSVSVGIFILEQYGDTFVESLILSTAAGFVITNWSDHRQDFHHILHKLGPAIFVAFFTLTGAALALDTIGRTILLSIILVLVRIAGIVIGSYFGGRIAGESERHNRISFMAYVTQAGVSLGLAKKVHSTYPQWGGDFATVIVSVVIVNQVIGPPLMKLGIRLVNEHNRLVRTDRAAVIFGDDEGRSRGAAAGTTRPNGAATRAVAALLEENGWSTVMVTPTELAFHQEYMARQRRETERLEREAAERKKSKMKALLGFVNPVKAKDESRGRRDSVDEDEESSRLLARGSSAGSFLDTLGSQPSKDGGGGASDNDDGAGFSLSSALDTRPLAQQITDDAILERTPPGVRAVVVMVSDPKLAWRIASVAARAAPTARIVVQLEGADDRVLSLLGSDARAGGILGADEEEDEEALEARRLGIGVYNNHGASVFDDDDDEESAQLKYTLAKRSRIVDPQTALAHLLANAVVTEEARVLEVQREKSGRTRIRTAASLIGGDPGAESDGEGEGGDAAEQGNGAFVLVRGASLLQHEDAPQRPATAPTYVEDEMDQDLVLRLDDDVGTRGDSDETIEMQSLVDQRHRRESSSSSTSALL